MPLVNHHHHHHKPTPQTQPQWIYSKKNLETKSSGLPNDSLAKTISSEQVSHEIFIVLSVKKFKSKQISRRVFFMKFFHYISKKRVIKKLKKIVNKKNKNKIWKIFHYKIQKKGKMNHLLVWKYTTELASSDKKMVWSLATGGEELHQRWECGRLRDFKSTCVFLFLFFMNFGLLYFALI